MGFEREPTDAGGASSDSRLAATLSKSDYLRPGLGDSRFRAIRAGPETKNPSVAADGLFPRKGKEPLLLRLFELAVELVLVILRYFEK